MTQRQWQEVFSIVRKHQKESFTRLRGDYMKEYEELREILDELYTYAYDQKDDSQECERSE